MKIWFAINLWFTLNIIEGQRYINPKQPKSIFSILAVLALAVFGFVFSAGSAEASVSGAFTSQIKDTGQVIVSWGNIDWTTVQPSAATQIVLKARTSNSATMSGAPAFSTCVALATITSANASGSAAMGGNSCIVALDRYIQYEATFSTTDNAVTPTLSDVTYHYTGTANYPTSRWLISSKYNADLGMNDNRLSSIVWNQTNPVNTSVKFQVRTASSAENLDDAAIVSPWCGPDDGVQGSCSSSTYFTVNTGQTIDDVNRDGTNDQWIQYKVFLISDGSGTPVLNDMSLGYVNNLTGNFTSSSYNTEQNYNVPYQLIWNETVPANTSVYFRVATSANGLSWTSFVGPDNTVNTQYESANLTNCIKVSSTVTCTIPAIGISDATDDQWIKYKVWLSTTDGADTPIITSVTFKYDLNVAPVVAVSSASQIGGDITISYNLSNTDAGDPDSSNPTVSALADFGITLNENPLPIDDCVNITIAGTNVSSLPAEGGTIQIEDEQITYSSRTGNDLACTARGANNTRAVQHSMGTTVWFKGTTATGIGSQAVGTGKTIVWTIGSDFNVSCISPSCAGRMRVSANDGRTGNQVSSETGATDSLDIDTKDPIYGSPPLIIDSNASGDKLTSITVTEDSTFSVRYANASNINGSTCVSDISSATYESLVGNSKSWTLSPDANGVSTVCFQAKDNYNNETAVTFASTPPIPAGIDSMDISYTPLSKWRGIVWWTAQGNGATYKVYRDAGAGYVLLGSVTDPNNYCFDEGDGNCVEANPTVGTLNSATTYSYKITAEDADGVSSYSEIITLKPDGTKPGVYDTSAPTVSTGPSPDSGADSGSQTSATITWTTNENSYSLVRYGTTTALGSIAGSATESVTSHSVAISSLSAGIIYYYQILSADSAGNLLQDPASPPTGLHTFTTTADSVAPTVSSGPTATAGRISATIYWQTNEASSSQVRYIEAVDNTTNPTGGTATTLQTEEVLDHYVIITGLTENVTYN